MSGFRGGKIPQIKIPNIKFMVDGIEVCNGYVENINEIPTKYIINKDATILFWEDGTKTIVKRTEKDEYNKRISFLTAYFQKHCGLTKNQANKYLDSLMDEDEKKALDIIKNKPDMVLSVADMADSIGKALRNMVTPKDKKEG